MVNLAKGQAQSAYTFRGRVLPMEPIITEEQQEQLNKELKVGIYLELAKMGILTRDQVYYLVEKNFRRV